MYGTTSSPQATKRAAHLLQVQVQVQLGQRRRSRRRDGEVAQRMDAYPLGQAERAVGR
jgi:hypothetical protein